MNFNTIKVAVMKLWTRALCPQNDNCNCATKLFVYILQL